MRSPSYALTVMLLTAALAACGSNTAHQGNNDAGMHDAGVHDASTSDSAVADASCACRLGSSVLGMCCLQ
jgi:hypothetical protein